MVIAQARAVLEDMPVTAFKAGMLGSAENATALAAIMQDYPDIPLILDPILTPGAATRSRTMRSRMRCSRCSFAGHARHTQHLE